MSAPLVALGDYLIPGTLPPARVPDTLPCPPPSRGADAEEAARACCAAFHRALGVPVTWGEVPEAEREAWRRAAAVVAEEVRR